MATLKGMIVTPDKEAVYRRHISHSLATIADYRAQYGQESVEVSQFQYDNGQLAPMTKVERCLKRDLWALDNCDDRTLNGIGHIVLDEINKTLWVVYAGYAA